MAVRRIKSVLLRYFLLVCVMAVATAGAMSLVAQQKGVYEARVGVIVVPPNPADARNPFLGREFSLITTAGLMAGIVNADVDGAATSSSLATLAGQGVRDGYAVRLHNRGGQWAVDHDRPILDVQAVGATGERARRNLDLALTGLEAALTRLQTDAGIAPRERMSMELVPEVPAVAYTAPSATRAIAGTLLLGAAATVVLLVVIESVRVRRRASRLPGRRHRGGAAAVLPAAAPG